MRTRVRQVQILIVSAKFDLLSIIQRQRLVNRCLEADLHSGQLHSVRQRCLTPAQWAAKGNPQSFHPDQPCSLHAASPKSVIGLGPPLSPNSAKNVVLLPVHVHEARLPSPMVGASKPSPAEPSFELCEVCEPCDVDMQQLLPSTTASAVAGRAKRALEALDTWWADTVAHLDDAAGADAVAWAPAAALR